MQEIKKAEKYFLTTTTEGCATNLIENANYRKILDNASSVETKRPEEADIIIINTCAFTQNQEDRSVDKIKELQSTYPSSKVIVGGCLTKINPKRLKEHYKEEAFNPGDYENFSKILDVSYDPTSDKVNFFDDADFNELSLSHNFLFKVRKVYFSLEGLLGKRLNPIHNIIKSAVINEEFFTIQVSQGCAGKCTFCAIKFAKGHVKSKPIVQILHEFQRGLQNGYKKFWLLGDDIGCYGIDLGSDIMQLLREILELPHDFELVINYFEPFFLVKHESEIQDIFRDRRIINVNIPIQSGNDQIIKAMGRDYKIYDVARVIRKIKAANPNIAIKTNIIFGFPGESYSAFKDSIKALSLFDAIYALRYTPRPRTRSFSMKTFIDKEELSLRNLEIQTRVIMRHIIVSFRSIARVLIRE